MEFKDIMDAFAADVGMDGPMAYDDENACHLTINGRYFGFREVPEAGRMVIWCPLCERPPESGEKYLVQLLRANFMNQGLPEGALSLSDDDIVCAHCSLQLPIFDKEVFYRLLRRFVTGVDGWCEMLEIVERSRELLPQVRSAAPKDEVGMQV